MSHLSSILLYPSPLLLLSRPLSTSCNMLVRNSNSKIKVGDPRMWKNEGNPLNDPNGPNGDNDRVATHVRNRNPMNLEKMLIGRKPRGFELDRKEVQYWNKLELSISQQHTTAEVVHWTGRRVCRASTREWAIRRFLYNNTDATAVQAVGTVIGQRCIETGVCEVFLKTLGGDDDEMADRMRQFVNAVKQSGLVIGEGREYEQQNPHLGVMTWRGGIRPWEYTDS